MRSVILTLAPLNLALTMLSGCVTMPTENGASAMAPQLATMQTFQYLRIDAEKTGITNVADDGRYTYLSFQRAVPAEVMFFDQEGQAVTGASAGRIAALPRLFKTGLLVRIGQLNSYVAPNPRAAPDDKPPLEDDPEVIEARNRLELAATTLPSFRKAMQRADAAAREAAGAQPFSDDPRTGMRPTSASTYQVPPLPAMKPAAADDPTYQVLPNGVMIRVFFASGGRAIVRPDDGLQRLEIEARRAQEIRIAGYTDNVGAENQNASLARMRADAIRDHLVRRGIAQEKILVAWTGTGRYVADNSTALGRAMNRRVEVTFVNSNAAPPATQ